MSNVIIGVLGFISVILLLFIHVPVAFSMFTVGLLGYTFFRGFDAAMIMVGSRTVESLTSYSMCVVPLFGLMGLLAAYSGLGSKLFHLARVCLGHWRGGLCTAIQAACGVFGAICGSVPATITTMGAVAYPEMKKLGYDEGYSSAAIAAGSNLAVLIPPSTSMIIYGISTNTSIGKLFVAGIMPGILEMACFVVAGWLLVKKNPALAPLQPRASWKERREALTKGGVVDILLIFAVTIGGIFMGIFTATEAGAVGAFCTLVSGVVRRTIKLDELRMALAGATAMAAMCMILIAATNVFGSFFALTRIPTLLGTLVVQMDIPGWGVILAIVFIYLIMGMVMDSLAMILLTIPVFFPVVCETCGYDPLWFGVLVTIVITMGYLTPPIGSGVFIMSGAVKIPAFRIFKYVWPYVVAMCVTCILITIFPQICTFLVDLSGF